MKKGHHAQTINLDQLIVDAKAGDEAAFSELVVYYQPMVARLIMGYLGEDIDTADISQEIFLKVFRSFPAFRGDSHFYTWLYRIAMNTLKNHVSYQKHHLPQYSSETGGITQDIRIAQGLVNAETPENLLIETETEQTLLNTLKIMPRVLILSLLLHSIRGSSYREIAKKLNCPVGTVRSRIFRAKAMLLLSIGKDSKNLCTMPFYNHEEG